VVEGFRGEKYGKKTKKQQTHQKRRRMPLGKRNNRGPSRDPVSPEKREEVKGHAREDYQSSVRALKNFSWKHATERPQVGKGLGGQWGEMIADGGRERVWERPRRSKSKRLEIVLGGKRKLRTGEES